MLCENLRAEYYQLCRMRHEANGKIFAYFVPLIGLYLKSSWCLAGRLLDGVSNISFRLTKMRTVGE